MNRPDHPCPACGLGLFVAICVATAVHAQPAEPPFDLKGGDRVVLLGGTFIERDQTYGYLETLLTARYPDRAITFRNLGWSGDTVWGEARSRFGPPAEGFAHLKQHVEALKPTVIFVNYGLNESYAGKAGLPRFEQGLNTLLDVLDKTGARIVMITPLRLQKLPPPLPDPAKANERLADYVALIKKTAEIRKYRVVNLFDWWNSVPDHPSSDNGVHLNEEGYWHVAQVILISLGLGPPDVVIELDSKGSILESTTSKVEGIRTFAGGLSFQDTDRQLLLSSKGELWGASPHFRFRTLVVEGLAPGTYEIAIDGKFKQLMTRGEGDIGIGLDSGPETTQAEQLRAAINAKNELYFHRWRPQNETYLFGFRKHEQGNNAREIPLFDPLVAAKEAEIARLKVPVAHTYEITRKGEK